MTRGSKVFLIVTVIAATFVAGCNREPDIVTQIQAAGGVTALKRDCQAMLDEHRKTSKESWLPGDSLPLTIATLQPQVVYVTRHGDLPMVDIQVSGGFYHRGLMVMLANTPADFKPCKSSWRVTKIADGVFEYRE